MTGFHRPNAEVRFLLRAAERSDSMNSPVAADAVGSQESNDAFADRTSGDNASALSKVSREHREPVR